MTGSSDIGLEDEIAVILTGLGLPLKFELEPIRGGGNNRLFCLKTTEGKLALKKYFFHARDQRNRLAAEFDFISFAWQNGIRCIPRPIRADHEAKIGVYEYIEGTTLEKKEPTREHVSTALDFFARLNAMRSSPQAGRLGNASEACFTLRDHCNSVHWRLQRLKEIDAARSLGKRLKEFIAGDLEPGWRKIEEKAIEEHERLGIGADERLPVEDRRLSPSDFGFHNALVDTQGRLIFLDFEYAGWDDPAKMICDFFLQPKVPVSQSHFNWFKKDALAGLSRQWDHNRRVDLLYDVHKIKWCCLLLNEFLPVGLLRRRFSESSLDVELVRKQQLKKAIALYNSISD